MRGVRGRAYRYVYSAGEWKLCAGVGKARSKQCCRTHAVCPHRAGAAGTFGWIAAAGVLGAVPGRALWIALLTAVRGFLLSFAAAAALAQSGLWGIYIAFVSIGVSAVFWLPAMLLVGTAALEIGAQQSRYFRAWKQYGGLCLLCALLLLLSLAWRLLAVPVLLGLF